MNLVLPLFCKLHNTQVIPDSCSVVFYLSCPVGVDLESVDGTTVLSELE